MSIEEEIAELERELAELLIHEGLRRILTIKSTLLRNGYRLQPQPDDARLFLIVHLASGKVVYRTTANELRYARASWLLVAQQAYVAMEEN